MHRSVYTLNLRAKVRLWRVFTQQRDGARADVLAFAVVSPHAAEAKLVDFVRAELRGKREDGRAVEAVASPWWCFDERAVKDGLYIMSASVDRA